MGSRWNKSRKAVRDDYVNTSGSPNLFALSGMEPQPTPQDHRKPEQTLESAVSEPAPIIVPHETLVKISEPDAQDRKYFPFIAEVRARKGISSDRYTHEITKKEILLKYFPYRFGDLGYQPLSQYKGQPGKIGGIYQHLVDHAKEVEAKYLPKA